MIAPLCAHIDTSSLEGIYIYIYIYIYINKLMEMRMVTIAKNLLDDA